MGRGSEFWWRSRRGQVWCPKDKLFIPYSMVMENTLHLGNQVSKTPTKSQQECSQPQPGI